MDKNAVWKWLILVVLTAFSIVVVTPPEKKIRLGLDLKGGTSFTVQVDEDQIRSDIRSEDPGLTPEDVQRKLQQKVDGAQSRALEVLRNRIDNLGIAEPVIYPAKGNRIVIQLPGVGEEKRKEAERSIRSAAFLTFRMVHEKSRDLTEKLFERDLAPEGYRIVQVGGDSFYALDMKFAETNRTSAHKERVSRFHAPDSEHELMFEKEELEGRQVLRPYYVKRRYELSGDQLKNASVDYKGFGEPVVNLQFDARGAKKFASVTADFAPGGARNPNPQNYRQLAIVLDGTLYSAPRINEAIYGGRAEISGNFTVTEATFLSNVLRAGSLPVPVKIIERTIVDPSLGRDTIDSGVRAAVYGCIAVLVMMAVYYGVSGLLADLALMMNLVLLPLGLVMVAGVLDLFAGARAGGAIALPVLTLPGIAGIALTIGMAVDANVLIFERIREELRVGKGFAGAVQAGYDRALSAIFDSNITTIVTAVILFLFGSGPVRGYAVTLIAGLLVSLYTAVVLTRMCYNLMERYGARTSLLAMFSVIKQTSIDFVGKGKVAIICSVVLIVASWGMLISDGIRNPSSVFGVDFTGGSGIKLALTEKPPVDQIRAALDNANVRNATIQYSSGMGAASEEFLNIKVGSVDEGARAEEALVAAFPSAGFHVVQQEDVGPQIGKELKTKAMWAILWSLVAMIAYISWRFEFGFALGAVVAIFHDVLITAGLCHLLGFQINMTVIAALMTILGYSVNDTIVIFDRIREDLRTVRGKSFLEICNLSLNQTLSRTLLTSFLTLVSVGALMILGGGAIKDFAVTMFIGLIAGTYSTVFIATPVVLRWYGFKTPDLGRKTAAK
jgi:SecD/SecF fusion protein